MWGQGGDNVTEPWKCSCVAPAPPHTHTYTYTHMYTHRQRHACQSWPTDSKLSDSYILQIRKLRPRKVK